MAKRKLEIIIAGDDSSLRRALGRAGAATDAFGKKQSRGAAAMGAVAHAAKLGGIALGGGLVVGLKKSIDAFAEHERIAKQTDTVLRSTGGAANVTKAQVEGLAGAISKKSGIDDEAVQASENLLLTFRGVHNETGKGNKIFTRATGAIADMATAMNHGATPSLDQLHSTTILVGKALQDPVKGMTALRRVGVTLDSQQQHHIKTLVAQGKTMEAQKIVLGELSKEFGGSAKSAGDTFGGSIAKAKVALNNLGETIGGKVTPVLKPLAEKFAVFVQQMADGTGAGGRFVKKLGDIWAQIQPIAGAFIHTAGAVAQFVGKHPELVKIVAVLVAVEAARKAIRWADSVTGVSKLIGAISSLKTRSAEANAAGSTLGKSFASRMGLVAAAGIAGWEIGSWLRKHVPAVRSAGDAIGKALASALNIGGAAQALDKQMSKITGGVQKLAQTFKNATNPAEKNQAAIRLHITAAKAAAAQWANLAAQVAAGKNVMDPTTGKALTLKAAMDHMREAEQQAASGARNLASSLNAIPRDVAVNIRINRSAGGNAAGGTKHGKLAGAASVERSGPPLIFGLANSLAGAQALRDSTQASFDAADQASRRAGDIHDSHSKDKSTRKSAIADLKALNLEISRAKQLSKIDLKISGYEKAIQFKDAISQIRGSIHDLTGPLADKYRDSLTKGIKDSADAKELASLQAKDRAEQDAKTQAQLDQALADAKASGDVAAQKQAQDDIDAYARQKREDELQANIDAANANVDNEVQAYQDGLDAQVSALVDSLEQRKQAYADFVQALAAMGITFTASSDQEQAINMTANPTGVGNLKKTVKGKKKPKKHRATGGPIKAGEAYIVDENGEETFVSGSDGFIIPSSRGGGKRSPVINIYGGMHLKSGTDHDRWASRLAFKLATA